MKNVFMIVLFATLLEGCTMAYKPPAAGNSTASVRFFAPEAGELYKAVAVYALTDDRCHGATKLRHLGGIQMGGMSANETDIGMWKDKSISYNKDLYVEVPVLAEQRFNFSLLGSYQGASCIMTLSFLPRANRQYEVVYQTMGERCTVNINELTRDGDEIHETPVTTASRNEKECANFYN